jgi:hypothetical protein
MSSLHGQVKADESNSSMDVALLTFATCENIALCKCFIFFELFVISEELSQFATCWLGEGSLEGQQFF